jgi:metal-dependent amidase/aminoacylase/carboxypeptidase family protein
MEHGGGVSYECLVRGLEEHRTLDLVAAKLAEWRIELHRGVGRTGVVGVLRSGNGEQAIGLRAHIGALPTETARVKRNTAVVG